MPKFSDLSLRRLQGVDPRLVQVAHKVIETWDFTVIEGLRSTHRQQELLAAGKTKTLRSRHLTGHALDLAPLPIDWKDLSRFYYFGGYVLATAQSLGIKLRWGGDWNGNFQVKDQTFNDLVHFEIPV